MGAIDAISGLGAPPFTGVDLARSQRDFAAVLSRARTGETPEARAREAAESLVAITLLQPVLSQLRESELAAPPFEPTPAEKQFRALQDARLAQDIVRRSNFPLVERVARGVLMQGGAAAPAGGQGGPHARDQQTKA